MSHNLQLKRGGKLITKEWDPDIKDFVEMEIDSEDIGFHLYDTICLQKGVTLKDIFLLINQDMRMFSLAIGCPFLDDLCEEAFSDFIENEEKKGIYILELRRFMHIYDDGLEPHMEFHGVGAKETYALEFSPINELTTFPVILNESITIEDADDDGNIYVETSMKFRLFEVIKNIIGELAFMGPPDVRAFALEEIKKRCDEIDTGSVETCNFEALNEKIQQQISDNQIPCRICKQNACSAGFDKPSDVCQECFDKIKEN